jgi:phospholipid transport system substrate-binding protein
MALVILCATTASGAWAAPSQPADEFIRSLSKEAISSLGGKNISPTERESRFRAMFTKNFDVPGIARFVLGLYWRRATPAQQAEYVKLFEDFIVKAYSKQFGDYSGDDIKTGQPVKMSGEDVLVPSQLKPTDSPPVRVDWRLRNNDSDYKIVDVMVEGISMSVTHRDEFAAVIQASGGSVDGLLQALRKKTQ